MSNLFAGMEAFGFEDVKDMDVYSKPESPQNSKTTQVEKPKYVESDYLFDKTFSCPVCDKEFKSKMVKVGKVKLISADSDLRPKYQYLDSLKYDAVLCPSCGYAALNRFFNYMSVKQAKVVKEKITSRFKGIDTKDDVYSYDESIARHKLALMNGIVTNAKFSEKAYTCLKIAWLLRGKAENLVPETPNLEQVKQAIAKEENDFIIKAYEGFVAAFTKENFPMCGMDENTVTYLTADLARRCGKFLESSRLISQVLIARDASERIKAKARDLKDLLKIDLEKK